MRALARILERLPYTFKGTVALSGHVLIHDDCPHCDGRTLCEVSVLHKHARCLECGRSTREPEELWEESWQENERELVAA